MNRKAPLKPQLVEREGIRLLVIQSPRHSSYSLFVAESQGVLFVGREQTADEAIKRAFESIKGARLQKYTGPYADEVKTILLEPWDDLLQNRQVKP